MSAYRKLFMIASVVLGALEVVSPLAVFGQDVRLILPRDELPTNSEPISSISFSFDGKLIATGHGMSLGMLQKPIRGVTILWDVHSVERVKEIVAVQDGVRTVAFSPNGKMLVILEAPGIIRVIDLPEGREIQRFQMKDEQRAYYSVAFFPNCEQLVVGVSARVGEPGNEVLILELASGKHLKTLVGHHGPVATVAVSPDGKHMASGAMDGTARIWDAQGGKPMGTLKFPKPKIDRKEDDLDDLGDYSIWMRSVTFSPDGKTLAVAAADELSVAAGDDTVGMVGLWDVLSAREHVVLKNIDSRIQQVVFSPDGKTFVTIGSNTKTKAWDAVTFKVCRKFPGCYPFAFSPDGRTIAFTVSTREAVVSKSRGTD